MIKSITFIIPGDPVAAPRMTQRDKWLGRPCVVKYFNWRNRSKQICGQLPLTETIESVSIRAFFSPPASTSKKKRTTMYGTLHRVKPDASNVLKAVEDALFDDDQKLARVSISKHWAIAECVEITIEYQE